MVPPISPVRETVEAPRLSFVMYAVSIVLWSLWPRQRRELVCRINCNLTAKSCNDSAHRAGDFAQADIDEIERAKKDFGLNNVHFIKGLFSETAPTVLDSAGRFILAHIDCDIYESVCYAHDACKPFMVPGGYLIFDDSTTSSCIGATEAVEATVIQRDGLLSEQIWPHHVFRARGLEIAEDKIDVYAMGSHKPSGGIVPP